MDKTQYEKWTEPIRNAPHGVQMLVGTNRVLTVLGYIAFPLLLLLQAIFTNSWETPLRTVIVAGAGFVSLSVFRSLVNAPRPYQTLGIDPLIAKDTQGKSFPSRHAFSMFMIAFCWLAWLPPAGAILVVAGAALATIRVLGGVHWPRDVIAGLAWAAVFAVAGFVFFT